jgi:hypothetical protein
MKHLLDKCWLLPIALCVGTLASLLSATFTPPASAHGGGTPRLTAAPVGPYRLYAWSDPEPWRVGQVHLSLAVTQPNPDSNSNQVEIPVTDVDITVTFTPLIDNGANNEGAAPAPVVFKAVNQEFLGAIYYEADPVLSYEGDWQINVAVTGEEGSGDVDFPMETLAERTLNWTLIVGAGGLLIVILALIAVWSRSQKPEQPVRRPHRGVRRVPTRSAKPRIRKEA